jgi:hypothetical protein
MIAASTIYRPFVVGVRAAGCCDHSAARLFYQIILRSSTVCLFDVCLLFIVVTIHQCCRFADCRGWGGQKSRLAMGAGPRQILWKFRVYYLLHRRRQGFLVQGAMDQEWEVTMRGKGSVITFCALCAAIGATVLTAASARAVPLVGYSVHSAAIRQATTTQEARHVCRGHPRRCYYISRPEQTTRQEDYHRSGWNGM